MGDLTFPMILIDLVEKYKGTYINDVKVVEIIRDFAGNVMESCYLYKPRIAMMYKAIETLNVKLIKHFSKYFNVSAIEIGRALDSKNTYKFMTNEFVDIITDYYCNIKTPYMQMTIVLSNFIRSGNIELFHRICMKLSIDTGFHCYPLELIFNAIRSRSIKMIKYICKLVKNYIVDVDKIRCVLFASLYNLDELVEELLYVGLWENQNDTKLIEDEYLFSINPCKLEGLCNKFQIPLNGINKKLADLMNINMDVNIILDKDCVCIHHDNLQYYIDKLSRSGEENNIGQLNIKNVMNSKTPVTYINISKTYSVELKIPFDDIEVYYMHVKEFGNDQIFICEYPEYKNVEKLNDLRNSLLNKLISKIYDKCEDCKLKVVKQILEALNYKVVIYTDKIFAIDKILYFIFENCNKTVKNAIIMKINCDTVVNDIFCYDALIYKYRKFRDKLYEITECCNVDKYHSRIIINTSKYCSLYTHDHNLVNIVKTDAIYRYLDDDCGGKEVVVWKPLKF
jgi:hypothetical protein